MNCNVNIRKKICLAMLVGFVMCAHVTYGQETNENVSLKTPFHNQLFFNRFLINPTFSLVRENKSYLNILHRNQYATFDDNIQNYYVGFSNKMNERTALGIGVYGQWEGVMQEFGFNANYATSVQLGAKSRLTFGTNVTYLSEGINRNSVVVAENDPSLAEVRRENKIAVQPGIALSLGNFDIGLYATDLLRYNQTANELTTNFNDRSVKASLQYTHYFGATRGLFGDARLMPMIQLGKNADSSISYVGSLLLDLPNYGWLQTTYDDIYGMSLGVGFNVSEQLSLGYLLEKNLTELGANLGWNHELSLAYTFKDELTNSSIYISDADDRRIDQIVRNYEEQILQLKAENIKAMAARDEDSGKNAASSKAKKAASKRNNTAVASNGTGKSATRKSQSQGKQYEPSLVSQSDADQSDLAYENRLIIDQLILRQDSVERARNEQLEKKFETIVRLIRSEVKKTDTPEDHQKYNPVPRYGTGIAEVDKRKILKKVNVMQEKSMTLDAFQRQDYIELPIRSKNRSDIVGVESGYYLIANVYKNERYLNAFINSLNEKGLNAKRFYNKENGLYYVYLADFKIKENARTAIVSNLNGKYRDEKWIMEVYNPTATAQIVFED
ncbi:MAG: PorP/SprF family type IX secretion system membrane protein [Bacteroidota bacterium]